MTIVHWWTCPALTPDGTRCFDRMAQSADPRQVERDRDEHLRRNHAGQTVDPAMLQLSSWPRLGA